MEPPGPNAKLVRGLGIYQDAANVLLVYNYPSGNGQISLLKDNLVILSLSYIRYIKNQLWFLMEQAFSTMRKVMSFALRSVRDGQR